MNNTNWSYDEFIAFMLIYIANVDIEFAEEEKALIRSNVGETTFDKMLAIYDSMSDYKAYETILSYKEKYFASEAEKNILFEKMKDLFHADADYNIMEKELLHFLERMM